MPNRLLVAFILAIVLPVFFFPVPDVHAQSGEIERLQQQINERSSRISSIDEEIAEFERQLREVGSERRTLQSAINSLELERKKIQAEISRTENLISSTDLEINKLVLEINRTEDDIKRTREVVSSLIRREYQTKEITLLELFLGNNRLSDFWGELDAHHSIRDTLLAKVDELTSYNELLSGQRSSSEEKRESLSSLKNQYTGQTEVLAQNREEQSQLLAVTRNEERNYQQLLASKQEARNQILREMRNFESQLKFILDPTTVPAAGTAVFAWPLDNIIITQLFGGTEFAARNAGAYGGRPYHPGVDFGAPTGTPIRAPLSGVVRAVGNTDLVPGCLSWGQWTLIDHANGLSTLYAHQSRVSVAAGQRVSTGEIIGFVGNTGFSTGPHLHFSVFAKEGVSVRRFNEIRTSTSCGPATTPVAAFEAYLDPLLYLPPTSGVRMAL